MTSTILRPGGASLQRGVDRVREWIDLHLDHFVAPCRWSSGRFPCSELEPFSELCLVLYAVSRTVKDRGPFAKWVTLMADALSSCAAAIETRIVWQEFHRHARMRPQALLTLVVFPVLESLAGCRFLASSRLPGLLSLSQSEMQLRRHRVDLTFAFFLTLVGHKEAGPLLSMQATKVISDFREKGRRNSSSLYDLTHAVFYATDFGRHVPGYLDCHREWLLGALGSLALDRMSAGDYDLGAELLLCDLYLRKEVVGEVRDGVLLLLGAISSDGAVSPRESARIEGKEYFSVHYHGALTALLVLRQFMVLSMVDDAVSPQGVHR